MRWSAARTRPALVAGYRRLAGTFELHGAEGYSDACQLLSRQRVFAVPHAIREDVEGEGLGVLARARRPFAEHGLVSHVLARPPAPFRFGHGCGEGAWVYEGERGDEVGMGGQAPAGFLDGRLG